MSDLSCTWVVAPGGYGKTYLFQSYIQAGDLPAFWYNLDVGDSDIASFFSDFSEALESDSYGPFAPLSPDIQYLDQFSRFYFQQLAEQLERPTLLVLEDYHRVLPDSGLHEAIAAAIDSLSAGIRIVVLSREAPPPAFARAQSYQQIGLLDAGDLAVTEEEALELAKAVTEKPITDDVILHTCQRADGWVAGFVMLLGQSYHSCIAQESKQVLFHYFEHEVLRKTRDDLRHFLWQTALFKSYNAEMAQRLTARDPVQAILRELLGGNYFLQTSQSVEPVYRYHDLFRDYLLDYGRNQHADAWRKTVLRAADTLAESDELDAAASLYAEITDWESLGRLVNRQGGRLLQRGGHRTLGRWLTLLPAELKHQRPWLAYWEGCTLMATDPKQAQEHLRRTFDQFLQQGERTGALLSWAGVCLAYWRLFDDMRPLSDWLGKLEPLWRDREPGLSQQVEAQVAIGAFLCLISVNPASSDLAYWKGRLSTLLEDNDHPELKSMAATLLLIHLAWTEGDTGQAIMLRDALRAAERSRGVAPLTLIAARTWGDMVYEYIFGSPSNIVEMLENTIDLATKRGTHLYDATLYGILANVHLTTGRMDSARSALSRMEESLNWERGYDVGFYLWLREWEMWLSGRYHEAVKIGQRMHHYAKRLEMLQLRMMSHLGLAQSNYSLGRRSEALRHLAAIRQWSKIKRSRIGPCYRGLALAQFALQNGQKLRALKLLRITFDLAAEEGYLAAPFFRRDDLTTLYSEALSAGIQTDYCLRVIRSRELPAPRKMKSSEQWPWRVKVFVLGDFRLYLDGDAFLSKGKAQQKPLELLKALVALGGDAVPQEQLADMLWPDSEADLAIGKMKTTISRLRKLLGSHESLLVREGALSLNREYCWTDVWRFDELASEIAAATQLHTDPPSGSQLERLTEGLQNAYPQPFERYEREAWMPRVRQRLRKRYQLCIERLGQSMKSTECQVIVGVGCHSFWIGLTRCNFYLNGYFSMPQLI
jgi:tetratricopeptide (TPR) repeat protein